MHKTTVLHCFILAAGFFAFLFPTSLNAQVQASGDVIPYDMFSADLYIAGIKDREYRWEEYAIARENPAYPGQTQNIEEKRLNQKSYSGYGVGIGTSLPFLYTLFSNKERRFRIADDLGFGLGILSNHLKVKDALTNEKIHPTYLDWRGKMNADFIFKFYYGLQCFYRVSDLLDVGIKYYPVFANGNGRLSIVNKTWGLHTRIDRFYVDYRYTKYKLNKFNKGDYNTNGTHFISVKYLLPDDFTFKDRGYVFASVQSFNYQFQDLFQTGNTFTRPGYENYQQKSSHYNIFNVGLGLMVN